MSNRSVSIRSSIAALLKSSVFDTQLFEKRRIRKRHRDALGGRGESIEWLETRVLLSVQNVAGSFAEGLDGASQAHAVFAPGTSQDYINSIDESPTGSAGGGNGGVSSPFTLSGRWGTTATDGFGLSQGDPTTITWSIVPDGTAMPALGGIPGESTDPSNLVGFLGGIYGVTTNDANYTDEPWFAHFQSVFDRWSELTGVTYVYEPNDDGAQFAPLYYTAPGELGTRGDVRIGGHRIDGNSGVLAYNFFPSHGEMVIDTADNFYSNLANDSLRLRNTVAHEAGHGIGLDHVESGNGNFLMEPILSTSFDGPQLDDILGAQRHYGDRYEPNDTSGTSTDLGALAAGQTITIGADATDTIVATTDTSFVSVDGTSDADFFSFTVAAAADVEVTLTPLGPTYNQGPQGGSQSAFNTSAQSNLVLELRDPNGNTVLASADVNSAGQNEVISFSLPSSGTYFVRVSSTTDAVQMYQLNVSALATTTVSIAGTIDGHETGPVNGVFTVTQTATAAADTVLTYSVAGTSTSGSDYTALSGSVTIPAGSTSASITVPVIDDAQLEITETVILTLTGITSSSPGVAIDAANDDDSIDILDNEGATARLFIPTDLAGTVGGTVTVPVMVDVTAVAGIDLAAVDLAIQFDSTKFTASNFQLGTLLAGAGFSSPSVNTSTPGVLRVTTSSGSGTANLPQGLLGSVFLFDLTVTSGTPDGASALNLLANYSSTVTALTNNDIEEVTLGPLPTNADSDLVDGSFLVDNTAPALTSLTRKTPSGATTNADTLVFLATFSEDVQNVDAADFAVSGTTAGIAVTQLTASTYNVTISGGNLAGLNATVGLNLNSPAITDLAGNALPNTEPTTDETYLVDNTAPALTSLTRKTPSGSTTSADTLVFLATFSEDVQNVNAADFAVSGTTAGIVVTQLTASTYDVTISGGNLAGLNATVGLNLNNPSITDLAGNALPNTEPATDETYLVDNTAPALTSLTRKTPSGATTNADILVFLATFSEDVQHVDAADFAVSGTTAGIAVTQLTASTYDVTISGGNLAGLNATVGLNLNSPAITDLAGNALPNTEPATDQTYLVDNTAPALTSLTRKTPSGSTTNADTLVFLATFSEDVQNVDAADFAVSGTTAGIVVTQLTASTYDVTISGGDLAGLNATVGLNLNSPAITDLAGNALPNTEPTTDETYLVDNTAPGLTSLTRKTPSGASTNADTLVFLATFSEDVQNVNAADFAVSGTTAGIAVTQLTASTYDVTISGGNLAGLNATVGLNLNSPSITDLAGNALPNTEPTTDETYLVDNTAPALTSLTRKTPSGATTNADTLVFLATFSENVQDVDAADFAVSGTTAGIVVTQLTASTYDVTISGGNLAGLNAAVGLNLNSPSITDLVGNALPNTEPGTDETYLVENTAPDLASFTRKTPSGSTTNADTLVFLATFSEDVQNVDAADFAVSGTTAGIVVTQLTASTYDVTISGGNLAGLNATVGLNLNSPSIADLAGNALPNAEPATDETYVVDNTAPALTSLTRKTPSGSTTNADILVFLAMFSEDVQNVDAADFAVSGTTAGIVVTQLTASTYDVTISGGNLAGLNAPVGLNLNSPSITDLAGNALPNTEPATDETYLVDNTAPALTSLTRKTPSGSTTNADILVFLATFSEDVQNVDAADFAVSGTTAGIVVTQLTASTYDVTISGGNLADLNATVGLNLNSPSITDLAGNALPNTEPATDETYLVDNTAPALTSLTRKTPSEATTKADTLVFLATFSEDVQNVDAADFAVSGTTAGIVVTQLTASTYDVTISGGNLAALNATVGLNLNSPSITDLVGNALPNTEPGTDETYLVDNTAPDLTSFTRKTPSGSTTNADTLVFLATFSEDVLNVDAADFAVSGTTAGIVVTQLTASTYDVTISGGDLAGLNDTVGLNLNSPSITDFAGNALPNTEPATDETYLLDNTAPALTALTRKSPSGGTTSADTLVFLATFSEDVTNVDAADFAVSGTTAGIVITQLTASTYDVTISGGNLAGLNATVGLNLNSPSITDLAGNALPNTEPATDETYLVDNGPPALTSLTRKIPSGATTNADILVFLATFSEDVQHVDAADFAVSGTTAGIVVTQLTASTYDVTLSGGNLADLNATVGLNLNSPSITDLAGNALPNTEPATDETYLVDNTAPALTSFTRKTPSEATTNADTLVFLVTFSEDVQNVDAADFAVSGTTAGIVITQLTASTYDVTLSGGNLAGLNATVGLNLNSPSITDLAGNALPNTEPTTDETYLLINTLQASSLTPTSSGIVLDFNSALDISTLNLYDSVAGSLGPADLTLVGNSVGAVTGSLVFDADRQQATFIATGGPLAPDTYTLTLRSAVDGFRDTLGGLLDGNADGIPGDDYTDTFVITGGPVGEVLVSIPDFARGYGQSVDLPRTTDSGIPITLSTGQNVGAVDFDLRYDPALLTPTGFTTSIAGASALFNIVSPGLVKVTVSSATEFSANTGSIDLGRMTATVPDTAPYASKHILDLTNLNVSDTVGAPRPSRDDDGIHLAAYVGDQSGNQRYSGGDTTLLQRQIVGLGNGFTAYQLADPILLADLNRGGTITGGDTTLMQRVIVGIPVSQLPDLPSGVSPPAAGGPDPRLYIPTNITGRPNAAVTVPVMVDVTEAAGIDLGAVDLAIEFDSAKFTASNFRLGTLLAGAGFSAPSVNTSTAGILRVTTSSATGTANLPLGTSGSVFLFDLTVAAGAPSGPSRLNLLASSSTTFTELTNNGIETLTLVPSPTNADTDSVDGSFLVDNTAPALTSFTRKTPSEATTNADTLVFLVTFSEDVQNVDAADFAVSGTTAGIVVTQLTASTYDVTISGGDLAGLNDTVGLNLNSPSITDLAGNALPNTEPTTDETYLVDNTAPGLTSLMRKTPSGASTNADTLVFLATFSEDVQNVNAADFAVSGTTAGIVVTQLTASTYDVTISGGNLAGLNATVGLNLNSPAITDLAGNALPNTEPGTDETYLVDNTAPALTSLTRKTPSEATTKADTLVFLATFSEDVQNVDAADFAVSGTTAGIVVTQLTASTYDVTISGGNLAGLNATVGLNLNSPSVTDLAGNALPNTEPATDETYLVDNTAPALTSLTRKTPSGATTNADTLVFLATFSEDVQNVDAADFAVSGTTAGIVVTQLTASTYDVTISGGNLADLNATVGLNLNSPAITDLAGNALPNTEPTTDETYLVDNTAPALTSLTRKTPSGSTTSADTLVFLATFSEDVQNVNAADFAVSGTTAGIVVTQLTASTYDVTISGGNLAGLNATVGLNLNSPSVTDLAGNALPNTEPATDETYLLDNGIPVLLGLLDGLGTAPFTRTESQRPTLIWQQSPAYLTSQIWLTNVSQGEALYVQSGLQSPSYTPPVDLPVGRYRYWIRAEGDGAEVSDWSAPYNFYVVAPPTIDSITPRFDADVTVNWHHPDASASGLTITWQLWLNKVDVVPAEMILVENGLTSTQYDLTSLPNGRYKVWTRGYVTGSNAAVGATVTSWSAGEVFEIGGRPSVISIGDTQDDTPLITWTPVLGAVSYRVYLAPSNAVGAPVVDESGLTTASYQIIDPLPSGLYRVWVRAFASDGRPSPWSLTSQSLFSVNGVTVPILNPIPAGSDTTPLFSWTAATGAVRHEIFVSSVSSAGTAIIRDDTITGTSYTSATELAVGDYRYWVRAIGAAGQIGKWSDPVRFSIVSLGNDSKQPFPDAPLVYMAGASGGRSENLTCAAPVELLEGRDQDRWPISAYDDVPAKSLPLSKLASVDNDAIDEDANMSDEVMADWDNMILAEESVSLRDENGSDVEQPSRKGMFASLALLVPAVLRWYRRTERED